MSSACFAWRNSKAPAATGQLTRGQRKAINEALHARQRKPTVLHHARSHAHRINNLCLQYVLLATNDDDDTNNHHHTNKKSTAEKHSNEKECKPNQTVTESVSLRQSDVLACWSRLLGGPHGPSVTFSWLGCCSSIVCIENRAVRHWCVSVSVCVRAASFSLDRHLAIDWLTQANIHHALNARTNERTNVVTE